MSIKSAWAGLCAKLRPKKTASLEESAVEKSKSIRHIPGLLKNLHFKKTINDSNDGESEYDRRYWGPVKHITKEALLKLAWSVIGSNTFDESDLHVQEEVFEGSFHRVWIIEGPDDLKVAIKVAAIGHEDRWMAEDAINLRSEALTMNYINRNTKCPVPRVISFDTTLKNAIGCPYIMMEYVEGIPVHDAWFIEQEGGLPLEEVRLNILTSLASAMAELRKLQFDKIGMLHFDNDADPVVGPLYAFCQPDDIDERPKDDGIARKPVTLPVFASTKDYYQAEIDDRECDPRDWRLTAAKKISSLALACAPFTPEASLGEAPVRETFVLMHPDFNYQNIMITPDGKTITGIFDWDGVQTVPRCVGYAAVPIWLRRDWQLCYVWPGNEPYTHAPEDLQKYRKFYAEAMREAAGDESDWKLTENSVMYCALHEGLYGHGEPGNFAEKILDEVIPRQDHERFFRRLATGHWLAGELALQERLPYVLGY
ncbi:hypothetical protein AOQ84DRAFT_373248 [Glonium stellatum]|uniref:Aminoglycoside phosphotransferase domain-containing protein n=1 Tax=Glonium stellatum TaxID=574774 RepID=A0A8E2JWI7_9PEZI|nr:hypothetical protein AOQ84DRAFT_373248 [Glonium stellatum]